MKFSQLAAPASGAATFFDHRTDQEKQQIHAELQLCAQRTNLAGNVVPVWQDSFGRMRFIAPKNQHPFFTSVSYAQLYAQANKTLNCG